MYPQQYERRPAPVLVILLILGIGIFMLINLAGGPGEAQNAPKKTAVSPAVVAPVTVPTSVPATPAIQQTLAKAEAETRLQELRATQMAVVWEATAQVQREQMTQVAIEETKAAVYATAVGVQMTREQQEARIEQERKLATAVLYLAAGLAAALLLVALERVIWAAQQARREADKAAEVLAKQELRLVEARKQQAGPVGRPLAQPAAKQAVKDVAGTGSGKVEHQSWAKKPASEEKIRKLPRAG